MLSIPLLKQDIKSNYKLLLGFATILLAGMLGVYQLHTKGHVSADFLSRYLREFIFFIIPSVYSITLSGRLVAKPVSSGTMAYFLSTGNKRRRIVFTQAVYLSCGQALLMLISFLFGSVGGMEQFIGNCGILTFLILNLGAFCLSVCVGGICFLVSCIARDMMWSAGISGGIIGLFYLLHVTASVEDKLSIVKYATFFTLLDTDGILVQDMNALLFMPILLVTGIVLYLIGCKIFENRDLPL